MASFSANFMQQNYLRPSLFELVAQNSMITALRPAINYALKVGVPYVKNKLDTYFNEWNDEITTTNNSTSQKIKNYFLVVYPYIHFISQTISLAFNLMYAFGIDDSFSPLLKLAGLRLTLLTKEDVELIENREIKKHLTNKTSSLWGKTMRVISTIFSFILKGLTSSLPVLAFCLKIVEWWYSEENTTRSSSTFADLPIPPPPDKPKTAPNGIRPPINTAECALCNQGITNATALSTSGYVFCYPCIYQYLKQSGKCPITHLPTGIQQLVKIYPGAV
ncbi:Peroxisome assembly protein 12 [Trichoplax sp. H2]|nr:Peroxisome assembly protein 12 [Trichoplax sp. H2]|eukprot:RDD39944.1 Peroxisome assembly protein 12 [Trichoplax sp. H2]